MTETSETSRRIWVGCLHCYNSGELTGEWFDLATTLEGDITLETVHTHGKLTGSCEELWVMDHEGFGDRGEGNVSEFYAEHEAITDRESRGIDPDAWAAYVDNMGADYATVDGFEESFRGFYESGEDYAAELMEDIHGETLANLPDVLRYRIDWAGVWRDLEAGGDNWSAELGWRRVAIFRNI